MVTMRIRSTRFDWNRILDTFSEIRESTIKLDVGVTDPKRLNSVYHSLIQAIKRSHRPYKVKIYNGELYLVKCM